MVGYFIILLNFQTVDDFEQRLKRLLEPKYDGVVDGIMPEGYLEAPLAYDAIWAVALGKHYTNEERTRSLILSAIIILYTNTSENICIVLLIRFYTAYGTKVSRNQS